MKRFAPGLAALLLLSSLAASAEDSALRPKVKMETTLGAFTLELDADKAPISVWNFVQYVDAGFYNGLIFHRVIPDFMIQGGGYDKNLAEKKDGLRPSIRNEWQNGLKNVRGSIAMARLGGRADSATAQFFINVVDNAMLDEANDGAAYAVFGKVSEGMDVVDKIRNSKTIEDPRLPMGPVVPDPAVVIVKASLAEGTDKAKLEAAAKGGDEKVQKAAEAAKAQKEAMMKEFAAAQSKMKADVIAKIEADTKVKPKTTSTGLVYFETKAGEGNLPKPTDTVEVHYTGTLLDGTKFDSSRDRGAPASFPLNRVIKGWTEGVGMMKPGGRATLVIPSDLAYGDRGAGGVIPPGATLVFDVELLSIK